MNLIYGNEIRQIIDDLKQLSDQLDDQTKDRLKELENLLEYEDRVEVYGNEIRQIINDLKQLNYQLDDQTKDRLKELENLLEYEDRAEAIRIRHLGRDITDDDIRSHFEKEKLREKLG